MPKKKASDFRYDTGDAKIAWKAVGECVLEKDVCDIVRFLIPPGTARKAEYKSAAKTMENSVKRMVKNGEFAGKLTLGSKVQELEAKTCKMLRTKYASFLTNATAGFEMASKFAGLKPGDEVIAPAITFIATIVYPLSIGAKVVFADVDPQTLNMDPKDVARKITKKTKVIIPVHLGGYPVDMAPIMKIANKKGITVIEDSAHGFGGAYKGKMLGSIGHFGAFSFHEVKNITSLGEGGILVTNTAFGKQFAQARFVGVQPNQTIKNWLYDVVALSTKSGPQAAGNHSVTEIQAVGLINQLGRLRKIIAKRSKAAGYLNRRFAKVDGILLPKLESGGTRPSHHLYLLQIDPKKVGGDIQTLKAKLAEKGVVNIPHFAPLYKFQLLREMGYNVKKMEKSCPVAEEAFNHRFTHLPLYDFNQEQLKYLADAVIESVEEMKKGK